MSNDLKHIFDDFDPGVDDAHVEKRWEAIKPFLPVEEKSRGLLPWYRSGKRAVLALAALLLVAVGAYIFIKDTDSPSAITQQRSGGEIKSPELTSETKVAAPGKTQSIKPKAPEICKQETQLQSTPSTSKANRQGFEIKKQATSAAAQGSMAMEIHQKNKEGAVEKSEPVEVAERQTVALNTKEEDRVQTELLRDKQLVLTVQSPDARSSFNEVKPLRDKPGSKLTVEIFGGLDRYNNSTKDGDRMVYLSSMKSDEMPQGANSGQTYFAGVAIHHTLGRRFFVPLQAIYSGPQNVFETTNHGSNRLSKPVVSSISGQADTQVVYQHYKEVHNISARRNIRLGLGLGMRLFASPDFTISALFEGEVNRTSYLRTNTVTFSEEEYPAPTPAPAPSYAANYSYSTGYDPNSAVEFISLKYGAMAGIHMARRIFSQMAVTARITYHHSLQTTDMQAKSSTIQVQPKNLLFGIGLNYRLR